MSWDSRLLSRELATLPAIMTIQESMLLQVVSTKAPL